MASALNGLQCPTTQVETNGTSSLLLRSFLTDVVLPPQVCVKQCPSGFWVVSPTDFAKSPKEVFDQNLCVPSASLTSGEVKNFDFYPRKVKGLQKNCCLKENFLFQTVKGILDKELCPYYYTPTTPGRSTP